MNLLFIIVLIILAWRIYSGIQKGLVAEVISLIGLIALSALAILLSYGLYKYFDNDYVGVVVIIISVIVLILAYKLLDFFFFTAKVIVKLPILKHFDKVLGALVGVAETVVFIWLIYALLNIFPTGEVGNWIWVRVNDNIILEYLFKLYVEYPGKVISQFGGAINETVQDMLPLDHM